MKIPEIVSLVLIWLSGVLLIPLQQKLGYILLSAGVILLSLARPEIRRHLGLIAISLTLLSVTPINTDISPVHMLVMGTTLSLAVLVPLFVTRYIYKDDAIRFPFHHGRSWYKSELVYIGVTAIISYLLLPFYLSNTGAYVNWTVEPGVTNITKLFIGTNLLGIWDELFFVSTVLGLLRRHLRFWQANGLQAILFTGFLYELGFRGWAPLVLYPFALLQGYIFKRTESLLYVITIHLTLDLVLFLALIHAHHPSWMPIFLTH